MKHKLVLMARQSRPFVRKFKRFGAPLLVILTIVFFVYFFATHANVRHALATTSPWVLLEVGGLYALFILCLAWVYAATLRLCGVALGVKENVLLTSYSTIANFFGPLQSGPGVRAAYLKQKHNVRIRDYTLATLLYYACYAIISAVFLLIGSGKYWPLALVLVIAVCVGSITVVSLARRKFATAENGSNLQFAPRTVASLVAATVCQLAIVALIYYVELQAVHTHASPVQAIAYGGAANFSLFVSLTPGAIGFREAFLGFSQSIHHISTAGILAASIIDRSVFVGFLGLMFLGTLAVHANNRFAVKPMPSVLEPEAAQRPSDLPN